MDSPYSVEEEIEIEKINLPKFSETVLKNKKLKKNERDSKYSVLKVYFDNGIYYERNSSELIFPNGDKFKGLFNKDTLTLEKGNYFWKNGQIYYGKFDDKNRFNTVEGEEAKLTFTNGDIFQGTFENGKIGEGTLTKKNGMKIQADFADGKLNGYVVINNPKKNYKFEGFITNDKKDGDCETEVKIDNKTYLIKGYYEEGKKNGTFTIEEIEPNRKNLYIKGKYKDGHRNGYFDIIDKEKGININHSYISFLHEILINEYNKNYKTKLTGKENSLSITCKNNPIKQLKDLVKIRMAYLLTLDLSRTKINSISFLDTDEKTLFSLQNLILSYNNIKSLEPLINVYYPNLKKLIVNDNQIKSIECVKSFNFKELEELNLSSNPIESLSGINEWKFPKLFNLSLYRTNISDIKPLTEADFPSLTQLDIYYTKINKNEKITPILFKKCTSLKTIVFDRHY